MEEEKDLILVKDGLAKLSVSGSGSQASLDQVTVNFESIDLHGDAKAIVNEMLDQCVRQAIEIIESKAAAAAACAQAGASRKRHRYVGEDRDPDRDKEDYLDEPNLKHFVVSKTDYGVRRVYTDDDDKQYIAGITCSLGGLKYSQRKIERLEKLRNLKTRWSTMVTATPIWRWQWQPE